MKKYSFFLFLLLYTVINNIYAESFTLESSSFKANTMIPSKYTCEGDNISPPLTWNNIPPKTQSLALVMEDPDAPDGVWTHWIMFNISPNIKSLSEASEIPPGALQGKNSWGELKYGGPCPGMGVQRYIFTIYALDKIIDLETGTSRTNLLDAITSHVIGSSQLIGLYQKNNPAP